LDIVVDNLPDTSEPTGPDNESVRIAIIGRPNVGKSSLLNQLLGHERAIVSPVAGTTRDAVDTEIIWEGQRITLIDTAGIRRRGKVETGVEKYSVLRSARALDRADLALVLIDATAGVTAQDTHIAGMTIDAGVSVVVLVNKWDAVKPEMRQLRPEMEAYLRKEMQFLGQIPVLFISALTGQNVPEILPTARETVEARYQQIPTGLLNDAMQSALLEHAPPSKGGRRLMISYVNQADVVPPTFIFYVNDPNLLHFSYERYLENRIRELYPFVGTPIRLTFRGRPSAR
jgi:GTP-binding protein